MTDDECFVERIGGRKRDRSIDPTQMPLRGTRAGSAVSSSNAAAPTNVPTEMK
jgi:hypothetical protein